MSQLSNVARYAPSGRISKASPNRRLRTPLTAGNCPDPLSKGLGFFLRCMGDDKLLQDIRFTGPAVGASLRF